MGGLAFAAPGPNGEPALSIPRMSSEVYIKLRDQCMIILSTLYYEVFCPAEAPNKPDHGDVDILVSGPRRSDINGEVLKQALHAFRANTTNPVSKNFAVPLPSKDPTESKREQVYAQVDVCRCPEGHLKWELLMKSYGDLWQIVGKFLRKAGLVANDRGLHVRVQEIEDAGQKNLSMIYLSHDPSAVLSFLGLDEERWKAGFTSVEEVYEWCCQGRFFWPTAFMRDVENSNDRQRMSKGRCLRILRRIGYHNIKNSSGRAGGGG